LPPGTPQPGRTPSPHRPLRSGFQTVAHAARVRPAPHASRVRYGLETRPHRGFQELYVPKEVPILPPGCPALPWGEQAGRRLLCFAPSLGPPPSLTGLSKPACVCRRVRPITRRLLPYKPTPPRWLTAGRFGWRG